MDDKIVRYTIRVDRQYFKKFHYIVKSEGRSANKDIEQYIIKRVKKYEAENETIDLKEK